MSDIQRIQEPAREIPVMADYDVVVVGGGMAGVSARVGLVERFCALGGLATLGNIAVRLPLCDGRGNQVIAGLAEELLSLSLVDLREDMTAAWFRHPLACLRGEGSREECIPQRYRASFNPSSVLLAIEKLIVGSAGMAAALAVQQSASDVGALEVPGLQRQLERQGVLLDRNLVDATQRSSTHHPVGRVRFALFLVERKVRPHAASHEVPKAHAH